MRFYPLLILIFSLFFALPSWAQMESGNVSEYEVHNNVPIERTARYNMEFKNAELKDAIRFLAKIGQLNIVIPEDVEILVSASFINTPITDVINSIVKANGLDYAVENNILRIGKSSQFQDNEEDLKTETIRLKYASAIDLAPKLDQELVSDRGSVIADERTNSLVVRDRLVTIENIKNFLKNIDVKDSQVRIEAKIVEVTRDFSRALGIQWGVNQSGNRVNVIGGTSGAGASGNPLSVDLGAENATSAIGLLVGTLAGGTNIDLMISAAEQNGDAHIVSEPTIVTSNGVEAKIRSGESIYVKTTGDVSIGASGSSTTASGNNGLQQIQTGVELQVTPQISPGESIKLKIDAETSQPDFTRVVDGIPAIIDNTASTTVLVRDGETTIIGGLTKVSGSKADTRVPFLSKIPLFGNLFKSRTRTKKNSELMIFIRPVIVHNIEIPYQSLDYVQKLKDSSNLKEVEKMAAGKDNAASSEESGKSASKNRRFKNRYVRD